MNIECNSEALKQLTEAFRFNDAVIRNLVIKKNKAVVEASPLFKPDDENKNVSSEVNSDSAKD